MPGATRRDEARTGRAVNVVPFRPVERELELLGTRIEMIRMVVGQEEVPADPVSGAQVRVPPEARPEVGVVHVDAVVENGHDDLPVARRSLPGRENVEAFATEVPLLGCDEGRSLASILGNEIRCRKDYLIERDQAIGDLDQVLAGILAGRVANNPLV